MTDQEILDRLKEAQRVLDKCKSSHMGAAFRAKGIVSRAVEALEDRLAVQDWACGGPDSERLI